MNAVAPGPTRTDLLERDRGGREEGRPQCSTGQHAVPQRVHRRRPQTEL
ncbi:hypothetical protein ACF09J_32385 [Streptomyces sp. NPDC014889]